MLATAFGACDHAVLDVEPGTEYVLTRVNGEPLPVVVSHEENFTRILYGDTVRFLAADRFERVQWIGDRVGGSDGFTLDRHESSGVVRSSDRTFSLVSDACADPRTLALCLEPDVAFFRDGALLMYGRIQPAGVKIFQLN